jgi:hypothetical protein
MEKTPVMWVTLKEPTSPAYPAYSTSYPKQVHHLRVGELGFNPSQAFRVMSGLKVYSRMRSHRGEVVMSVAQTRVDCTRLSGR